MIAALRRFLVRISHLDVYPCFDCGTDHCVKCQPICPKTNERT